MDYKLKAGQRYEDIHAQCFMSVVEANIQLHPVVLAEPGLQHKERVVHTQSGCCR